MKTNNKQLKDKFWEDVLFVTPEEIKEDSIGIVSDDNVDSLIYKVRNETIDECLEAIGGSDIGTPMTAEGMRVQEIRNAIKSLKELYDTTK